MAPCKIDTMAPLRLTFGLARTEHAAAIAAVRSAAARGLGARHGAGHWANEPTVRAVLTSMREAQVLVARRGHAIVATCRLSSKRPWAIDATFFPPSPRPLYLTDMAVRPDYQGQGVGRQLLAHAVDVARAWPKGPASAIRLDAYDASAGAGEFYASCGYREVARVVYREVPLLYYEMAL
jgi:GNAT superfamily N-acetyltransferase